MSGPGFLRVVAAALFACSLHACGGGGSSGPPLSIQPANPEREGGTRPVGEEPGQGPPRASIHATGVAARVDTLHVTSLYGERDDMGFVAEIQCSATQAVCAADGLRDNPILLHSTSGLAQAPVLDIPAREGIDLVGQRGVTENFFGGWLHHSGFGIRTARWDITEAGALDVRYAMAFGDFADGLVIGPTVLPDRTWRGHVVAVRPALSFWESVIYGDAEIRFTSDGRLVTSVADVGFRVGTLHVDFTNIRRLRDGRPDAPIFFAGLPVEIVRADAAELPGGAESLIPEGEEPRILRVMFGGGVLENRLYGGFFGSGGSWDEVAGVFEQNGLLGGFGGNAEETRLSGLRISSHGGLLEQAGSVTGLDASCVPGRCTVTVDGFSRTAGLGIEDTAGRDFGVGHDVESAAGVRWDSFGGWGRYSAFEIVRGVEEGAPDPFEFALPVSTGLASGSNPVQGSATWSGSMAGVAYDAAGLGDTVRGDVELVGDLAGSQLDLDIRNIRAIGGDGTWDDISWTEVPMTAGAFSADRGLEGRFFGPGQEEVGGVFDTGTVAGAFGAGR